MTILIKGTMNKSKAFRDTKQNIAKTTRLKYSITSVEKAFHIIVPLNEINEKAQQSL